MDDEFGTGGAAEYSTGKYIYSKIDRAKGTGPVRLGEKMVIRDDLYSMLFITTLHAEYIQYYEE